MADGASFHRAMHLTGKEREPDDFYETPWEATRALTTVETFRLHDFETIWEPAAGNGAICRELHWDGLATFASDLRDRDYELDEVRSFYDFEVAPFNAIVTNPPFKECSGSMPWLEHALGGDPGDVVEGGLAVEYMALLLPSTWPHARGRREFLRRFPIAREWRLGWRLDWTGQKNSPASHSWFVWDRGAPTEEIRSVWRNRTGDRAWRCGVLYRDDIPTGGPF